MALSPDASAAAAVAALFFAATLCAPINFRLTGRGFRLYIPIGLSTAFRGVAHAAHAAFLVKPNMDLLAVYGALNAAGLGIAVAMCCCFIVIWLRSAAHYQPPAAAKVISLLGRTLVAAVIAFGPVLGVVAAILVYGTHFDPAALAHGQDIRMASSSGFTAVTSIALLVSTYLAATWLLRSRRAAAAAAAAAAAPGSKGTQPEPLGAAAAAHQQQAQRTQDGLIFVLWGCLVLLCWCASSRLASFYHPQVTAHAYLYYTVSVLPELIVAFVFAAPTLAARIALGGRYEDWLRRQRGDGVVSGSESDAEVGVEAAGVDVAGKGR